MTPPRRPHAIAAIAIHSDGTTTVTAAETLSLTVLAGALRDLADDLDAVDRALADNPRCQFGAGTDTPCTDAAIDVDHGVQLCSAHFAQVTR